MKSWTVIPLILLIIFCFYHYLLALMHLESLFLTGVILFGLIVVLIRMITRPQKK